MDQPDNLAYGKHIVLQVLNSGRAVEHVYIAADSAASKPVIAAAREASVPYSAAGKAQLDRLAGGRPHQGVVAILAARDYTSTEDLWKATESAGEEPFLLVVPEIYDPGNLGALLRSACGAGVQGTVIGKRRACGLTAAVSKASAGADERMPVARVSNAGYFLDQAKDRGLWIVGADAKGTVDYTRADLTGPTALLLGSEEGLGPVLLRKCDTVVRIPMRGELESLNVSVAGALLMFEIRRQRDLKANRQ